MDHAVAVGRSISKAKHKLETVLFGVWVPVRPIPVPRIVGLILDLPSRDPERDSFIWLGRDLSYTH